MANPPPLPRPAANKMIAELLTPDPTQTLFYELVARDSDRFQALSPIPRGSIYSECPGADDVVSDSYPKLYFCKETVPLGSNLVAGMKMDEWVIWHWATVPDAESNYNAEISYLADSITNPVFARVYTIRRDQYDDQPTLAIASSLTALTGVKITKCGSGYTTARAEFDCYGECAAIRFVIEQGRIIDAIVEKEGVNFNLGSIIKIVGDGDGAECEPIIQAAEAILTSQKKIEFDDSDPMSLEFVKVLRVYELLPGPWVYSTRYDPDLGQVRTQKRALLADPTNQGGSIQATKKDNFESRGDSSVVALQIRETWTTGKGTPGNDFFPFRFWSTFTDERGVVEHTSQIVIGDFNDNHAVFNRPNGPGTDLINLSWFEPYEGNQYLQKKRVDTWNEPVINDFEVSSDRGGGIISRVETTDQPGFQSPDTGKLVLASGLKTVNPAQQTKETRQLAYETEWPILPGYHCDEVTGIKIDFTKQWVDANTSYPGKSGCRGPFQELQPYDRWVGIQIVSKIDLNTLPDDETWVTTHPVSLPPTLLGIEAIWTDIANRQAYADKGNGRTSSPYIQISFTTGAAGGIAITSSLGPRGQVLAKRTRIYRFCHPQDSEIIALKPLLITPSSGSVVLTQRSDVFSAYGPDDADGTVSNPDLSFMSSLAGGGISEDFQTQVHASDLSGFMVGNYQLTGAPNDSISQFAVSHKSPAVNVLGVSGGGKIKGIGNNGLVCEMQVRIRQSSPSRIPRSFIAEVSVTEWRFGLWVLEYIEVFPFGIP